MQFLERLADYDFDHRWLGESNGALRVAWCVRGDGDNPDWLARTQVTTQPFHGAIHPRVAVIHRSALYGNELLFEVDDDRGPTLVKAAAQLADPLERERWSVAQVIGLAEGIAALQTRGTYAIRIEDERIFVDESGHARLRAPIVLATRSPSSRTGSLPGPELCYFAPEVVSRQPPVAASNVFSLAINLYEALAGLRPFRDLADDSNVYTEMYNIVKAPPHPLETTTPGLARVIVQALEKDPAQRMSPAAFAAALREVVPDAADYDAVISDRIVAWRAVTPERKKQFEDVPCQQSWGDLPPGDELRHCAKCNVQVLRIRDAGTPFPLHGWSCRPKS